MPDTVTAIEAQALLEAGNARFLRGAAEHPHLEPAHLREQAREGQNPFATIVGCSDSRCPVELIFDAGVGDIFVIRVAGNICTGAEIASVEYAVGHLETSLVAVMGHSRCGAVTAAVKETDAEGHISEVLAEIEPSVRKARGEHPEARGDNLVDLAARNNIWQAIENLFRESPTIARAVREEKLVVVGAFLELETGRVSWLGVHPQQAALMMN